MSQKTNYIYIIRVSGSTYYKIGRTKKYRSRFDELQTSTPYTLETIAVFEVADAFKVEAYLHHKLANYKVRGEWFDFTNEQVEKLLSSIEQKGSIPSKQHNPIFTDIHKFLSA
jgi:hypothetical protein